MKLVKKLSRAVIFAMVCLMVLGSAAVFTLAGDEPYDTYNYNFREDAIYTPSAYSPSKSITGVGLTYNGEPLGKFVSPQDICRSMEDDNFYVADTGNNRIVVFNNDMTEVINVISSFDNNGKTDTFNAPYGVCVSEKGQIYIADSQNRRVVVLEKSGELVRIVDNPVSQSLEEGYVFTPLKVTVDYADRIYCIAQNMFEGIMVFESDGNFTGFFGTINVKLSAWDKFWKRIATKEERKKQKLYIPTEFTGIDVDTDGFIYATNVDADGVQAVRRLNPRGEDVIKKGENKNVGGDLWIQGSSTYAGASQITDVVYRGSGMYSMLDRKRGRIFTYDHEGNLLYIFGGLGTQTGTFKVPAAIEAMGSKIVVLDSSNETITIFEETEYGKLINEAIALRYDGDETQAVEKWRQVLKLDENNELANTGIGKAYLTAGENKLAMKYLKLGMNSEYYSIAFRRYRNELLEANLSIILSVLAVIIVGLVVFFRLRKRKKNKKAEKGGMNVG